MWHLGTNTHVDGGPSMSEAVLGIDIGGTNMAGGLISSAGEILHKVEIQQKQAGAVRQSLVTSRALRKSFCVGQILRACPSPGSGYPLPAK